jgi:hypothetical protein
MSPITDGKSLNAALKTLGISRRQLGAQAGCALNTVYRWVSGDLPVPVYVRTIMALNELLLGRLRCNRALLVQQITGIDAEIRAIQRGDDDGSEQDPPDNEADMAA